MLTERVAIDSDRIEVDHIEDGRIDGDRLCVLFWVTHGGIWRYLLVPCLYFAPDETFHERL